MKYRIARYTSLLILGWCITFLTGLLEPCHAQSAKTPRETDAGAVDVLHRASLAYKGLKTYSDNIEIDSDDPSVSSCTAHVLIVMPSHLSIQTSKKASGTKVIADGKQFHITTSPGNVHGQTYGINSLISPIKLAFEKSGLRSSPIGMILEGEDFLRSINWGVESVRLETPELYEGIKVFRISVKFDRHQAECKLVFGAEDFLLRQYTFTRDLDGKTVKIVESHRNINTAPSIPTDAFTIPSNAAAPPTIPEVAQSMAANGPVADVLQVIPSKQVEATFPNRGVATFGPARQLDTREVVRIYRLKNVTSRPLIIKQLSSACGCIAAVLNRSGSGQPASAPSALAQLQPKGEIDVRIALNLSILTPGFIDKTVSIYVQGNALPVAVLELRGEYVGAVDFAPSVLDFGQVKSHSSVSKQFTMSIDRRLIGKSVPAPKCSNPAIEIVPIVGKQPDAKKQQSVFVQTYRVVLSSHAPAGPLNAKITLGQTVRMPLQATSSSTLAVSGKVLGDVAAVPASLMFGPQTNQAGVPLHLWLIAGENHHIRATAVHCNVPWLSAQLQVASSTSVKDAVGMVAVTLQHPKAHQTATTDLFVDLSDGTQVKVPVFLVLP